MSTLKIKKLNSQAILPVRKTDGAAGYDLAIPETIKVLCGRQVIPLGYAIQLEKGTKADIDPRSGFSAKGMEGYLSMSDLQNNRTTRFDCDVIHGMVDSDYTGSVGVIINNRSGMEFILKRETRIAQMVITKHETPDIVEVENLDETERGDGGFGHTGSN